MENRKGYISVIALIIMSVLMIMSLYLGYIIKLEHFILESTTDNIQAYYYSEGKILMSLLEGKYYDNQLCPMLEEHFRSLPFPTFTKDIVIDEEDLEQGDDMKKVKVVITEKDGKKVLKLISDSNMKGLKAKVTSTVSLFNELVDNGKSPLLPNLVLDFQKKDFNLLLNKIIKDIDIHNCNRPSNIYGMESSMYSRIDLYKKGSKFVIAASRDNMQEPYIEEFAGKAMFLVAKKYDETPVNFFVGDSSNLEVDISGVLFVEGNLIITSKFKFNGIIVVVNGGIIIDTLERPSIKGLLISDELLDHNYLSEKADIAYDRFSIYKYGTLVPGFLEPKINLMKSD
ncbi:hypothetical protein [Tissierella sp.]|uniref:hypothetical protein n=1 Tax=Tissierella sp. TaxID=41274 RepID=UPI0028663530|nr:hypothetical protein [Tissierella sp.]MDR7856132.1 hypothetical protein [Tissierella sp.]